MHRYKIHRFIRDIARDIELVERDIQNLQKRPQVKKCDC
jgi:hypothetical protein